MLCFHPMKRAPHRRHREVRQQNVCLWFIPKIFCLWLVPKAMCFLLLEWGYLPSGICVGQIERLRGNPWFIPRLPPKVSENHCYVLAYIALAHKAVLPQFGTHLVYRIISYVCESLLEHCLETIFEVHKWTIKHFSLEEILFMARWSVECFTLKLAWPTGFYFGHVSIYVLGSQIGADENETFNVV